MDEAQGKPRPPMSAREAFIQGNQVKYRVSDVVIDPKGRPQAGLSVTIRHSDDTLATLWAEPNDDTSRITNPLTTAADGSFSAWVEPGDYFVAAGGATKEVFLRPATALSKPQDTTGDSSSAAAG